MTYVITEAAVSLDEYVEVAENRLKVELSEQVLAKVAKCRQTLDDMMEQKIVAYGITTGFGHFKDKIINQDEVEELQMNLIRSHAVGMGINSPDFIVRGMLFHRILSLSKGLSGVSVYLIEKLVEVLNKNLIPYVPELGTCSSSGDLCPLSHLIIAIIGEGKAKDPETGLFIDAMDVLKKLNIEPIKKFQSKEGLALNNGTQFTTAWAIFAWTRAWNVYKKSNIVAGLSLEALHGTHNAFDSRIHEARPHPGQIEVAREIREILNFKESEIYKEYGSKNVQDVYSLRCIPQIHGVVYDNLVYTKQILTIELNSVNDNPLIFGDEIISGGNFHGMYLGNVTDLISYSMCLICNISQCRTDRLVCGSYSHLPTFLAKNGGLHSALMIVQYTSSAITAEVRTMSTPASINSLPTCAQTEDITAMSGYAARKAFTTTERAFQVLGNEFFTACQALDFTKEKPSAYLYSIHQKLREKVPFIEKDTFMHPYILIAHDMLVDL
jgi:histidine ammonia-lyase